jgi:hypothetical protein
MARKLRVPLSTARARLFKLADLVSNSDGAVVVLERRGHTEPVALVREARLAYLESRVAELEKREEVPFRLAGSLATPLDDAQLEQALRAIRIEWTPGPIERTARPRVKRLRRRA